MMLTTPPMASEPYTAEAPSLSTSIRSMAATGIEFRSTESLAPFPPGTNRRPLSSTSVRAGPRPRRATRVAPLPPLLTWVLMALPCSGRLCRKSPIETLPLATTWSLLITVTGAGVVRSLRRMRDPVTTICSSALFLVAAAASSVVPVVVCDSGGGCCAADCRGRRSEATSDIERTAILRHNDMYNPLAAGATLVPRLVIEIPIAVN